MRRPRNHSWLITLAQGSDLPAIRRQITNMSADELAGLEKTLPVLARTIGPSLVLAPLRRMIRRRIDKLRTDDHRD